MLVLVVDLAMKSYWFDNEGDRHRFMHGYSYIDRRVMRLQSGRVSRHCRSRSRRPVARTARRSIAARTDASGPTTRTLPLARVTAV
jgi:hypothetical protein